jgi:hypothetical protein
MGDIQSYRNLINELNALDNSMNTLKTCLDQNTSSGVFYYDLNDDSYYVTSRAGAIGSVIPSANCSIAGGNITFETLKTQITEALIRLNDTQIKDFNSQITNANYQTTLLTIEEIKTKYQTVINKRKQLDIKMQELYKTRTGGNDNQLQTDSAVYGTLLWTVLATTLLYYVFIKM